MALPLNIEAFYTFGNYFTGSAREGGCNKGFSVVTIYLYE
jgi:hypothetical protein